MFLIEVEGSMLIDIEYTSTDLSGIDILPRTAQGNINGVTSDALLSTTYFNENNLFTGGLLRFHIPAGLGLTNIETQPMELRINEVLNIISPSIDTVTLK